MEVLEESIFPEKRVVYARFWTRFAASFIDGLIVLVPLVILMYIRGLYSPGNNLINFAAGWLYNALQESGPQQATIGKKAMGIKVTTLYGGRLTFMQATGRHFGKLVSSLILGAGYLMMLWDDKKQTLHDKMAGALVVEA